MESVGRNKKKQIEKKEQREGEKERDVVERNGERESV